MEVAPKSFRGRVVNAAINLFTSRRRADELAKKQQDRQRSQRYNRERWEERFDEEKGSPTILDSEEIIRRRENAFIALEETITHINDEYPEFKIIGTFLFGSYAFDDRAHENSDLDLKVLLDDDSIAPGEQAQEFLSYYNNLIGDDGPKLEHLNPAPLKSLLVEVENYYHMFSGGKVIIQCPDNIDLRDYITSIFDFYERIGEEPIFCDVDFVDIDVATVWKIPDAPDVPQIG